MPAGEQAEQDLPECVHHWGNHFICQSFPYRVLVGHRGVDHHRPGIGTADHPLCHLLHRLHDRLLPGRHRDGGVGGLRTSVRKGKPVSGN